VKGLGGSASAVLAGLAFGFIKESRMTAIRNWLMGKKTYVVGIGGLIAAVVAWTQGSLDNTEMVEAIVAALLAMTLRAGVKSAANGA
jgi:hypothetical protein